MFTHSQAFYINFTFGSSKKRRKSLHCTFDGASSNLKRNVLCVIVNRPGTIVYISKVHSKGIALWDGYNILVMAYTTFIGAFSAYVDGFKVALF